MTLQLYDLLFLSRSPISNRWVLLLSVATFFVAFWRNNGIYILVVIALVLLIVGVAKAANNGSSSADAIRNGRSRYFVPAVVLVAFSVAQVVITGPLYDSLGIGSDSKTESYGIPINQIARVVALDGEMSDADRAFFEALIPTARVREVYSPTCVDSIKYDAQFNYELLGHEDFWLHWLSLFLRNPRVYFEAWELQTCGFWTVNVPQVMACTSNVSWGPIWNLDGAALYERCGIEAANLFNSDIAQQLFPYRAWSVPIGVISWALLFLCACIVCNRSWRTLLVLLPSAGLLATLLVASPIWYWPRYGMPLQLLIPFYLFLLVNTRLPYTTFHDAIVASKTS